jgi:nucleotide-binding universal stress UspA family protein
MHHHLMGMTDRAENGGQRRIVVGVDGSPASEAAVRWAAAEARLRGMRLHVVHVRDPHAVTQAPYAPPGVGQGAAGHVAEGSALKTLTREAVGADGWAAVQFEVADGLPVRVLLDRAPGAAMLVLGSTRSAGLADAAAGKPKDPLGPVARDCLRAAPCPVVIVTGPGV